MAEPAGAAGDLQPQQQAQQQQQQQQPRGWMSLLQTLVIQLAMMYVLRDLFSSGFKPPAPSTAAPGQLSPEQQLSMHHRNIFNHSQAFDLSVYCANHTHRHMRYLDGSVQPLWQLRQLNYDNWTAGPAGDGTYQARFALPLPLGFDDGNLADATAIALHLVARKPGCVVEDLEAPSTCYIYSVSRIDRRYPAPTVAKTRRLLSGTAAAAAEESQDAADSGDHEGEEATKTAKPLISWWHENVTIALLTQPDALRPVDVPAAQRKLIDFFRVEQDDEGQKLRLWYKPHLAVNTFWDLRSNMYPINSSTPELPLQLIFQPLSHFRWQLYEQMDEQWAHQQSWMGDSNQESQQEQIKHMFLETNVYLLGVTMFVSLLHTVLEIFAFKNEIQFWRSRKSSQGLSTRTIFISIAFQAIIFLYLLDNSASALILISSGVSILIECWKITKACKVTLTWRGWIPWLKIEDKAEYVSSTKKYDDLAMKYLSWALLPCFIAYAIYSLVYEEHKGWYSYIVNMLAGGVYTFGFIMMTPQLFINYKLKSVAHMPWRMLTYRFLNTIIDDLFAFIIKMPTMHRLACFRDDVVFIIYLYQRWCYPVDKKRRVDLEGEEADTDPAGNAVAAAAAAATAATPSTVPGLPAAGLPAESSESPEEANSADGSSASADDGGSLRQRKSRIKPET